VWALEAFGAAYALQELLTIKSDDVLGRVQGLRGDRERENIPEPGIPRASRYSSKKCSLSASTSRFSPSTGRRSRCTSSTRTCSARPEELGIDISRPERGSDEEDERRAAERSFS